MKIAYIFDEQTKEFLYQCDVQESPLEVGIYLQPANSTYTQIIDEVAGFYNYWNGTDWELKKDTRGIWCKPSREEVEVSILDFIIPNDWTKDQLPMSDKELISIEIYKLESSITPRRLREAVLGDGGWLADIDLKIKKLRGKH
jgi:hypothetical protein